MPPLLDDFASVKTTSDFMRLEDDASREDRPCRSIAAISAQAAC
jgi:hypothetical protein